jgi:hypothetical protein
MATEVKSTLTPEVPKPSPKKSIWEMLFLCCAPSKMAQEDVPLQDLANPAAPVAKTPSPPSPSKEAESDVKFLLPPQSPEHAGLKCLVLDLDETLLHSSFKVS